MLAVHLLDTRKSAANQTDKNPCLHEACIPMEERQIGLYLSTYLLPTYQSTYHLSREHWMIRNIMEKNNLGNGDEQ